MTDDAPYAGRTVKLRRPNLKPAKLLFAFYVGAAQWLCELREFGEHDMQGRFFQNEELRHGRHWPAREPAIARAEHERINIAKR